MAQPDDRRFAIYFAPQSNSPLNDFGSALLGRDVLRGITLQQSSPDGLSTERWRQITSSPRMYGFHATLKPPFHLATGRSLDELISHLDTFSSERRPFLAPPLRLARISSFIALVLREDSAEMSELAEACVTHFDAFRAPASPGELERRKSAPLTPRQLELLDAWGYPYVFEEWGFHMSLASGLSRSEAEHLVEILQPHTAPHCRQPLPVDAVCLFEQPVLNGEFRLVKRFPFNSELP